MAFSCRFPAAMLIVAVVRAGISTPLLADEPGRIAAPKVLAQEIVLLPTGSADAKRQVVVRDADELAKALAPANAEQAEELVCRALKIKQIDFNTQMLLVLAIGPLDHELVHRQELTQLSVAGRTLTVAWGVWTIMTNDRAELPPPKACIALVEKFDGPVRFAQPSLHGR